MDAHGKAAVPRRLQVLPESKDRMYPTIKKWADERKKVRFTISGEGHIIGTEKGGWIIIDTVGCEAADLTLEAWYKRRTLNQLNTLKALEALLFYANHEMYPPKSEMLYGYHQVIMELTGIRRQDPYSGKVVMVTTSMEMCTTVDMHRFISTAFRLILECDSLPPGMIEPATNMNVKMLYRAWYQKATEDEALYAGIKSWDDYLELFPYDEFHLVARNEAGTGATQKIHIVSRGAEHAAIDEPWNWIHGATSVHEKIHNSLIGWEGVLHEFPHMTQKVRRAREIARKKELI